MAPLQTEFPLAALGADLVGIGFVEALVWPPVPVPTINGELEVLFTCWKSTCGVSEVIALFVDVELDSVVGDIVVIVDVDAEVAGAGVGVGVGVVVGVGVGASVGASVELGVPEPALESPGWKMTTLAVVPLGIVTTQKLAPPAPADSSALVTPPTPTTEGSMEQGTPLHPGPEHSILTPKLGVVLSKGELV